MSAPIVFFDIAGPDVGQLAAFYSAVFGWKTSPGPFPGTINIDPFPVRSPLPGTFRQEVAGAGPTMPGIIYVGVPDVAATLTAIVAHGGQVHAPRFEVPGVVVLGLFRDPAGSPMGLVEMDGDQLKVP